MRVDHLLSQNQVSSGSMRYGSESCKSFPGCRSSERAFPICRAHTLSSDRTNDSRSKPNDHTDVLLTSFVCDFWERFSEVLVGCFTHRVSGQNAKVRNRVFYVSTFKKKSIPHVTRRVAKRGGTGAKQVTRDSCSGLSFELWIIAELVACQIFSDTFGTN